MHSSTSKSAFSKTHFALERLDGEVIAARLVQDDHVERRGRRSFLAVTAHVGTVRGRPAVQQLMNLAGVAVEVEDDVRLRREELEDDRQQVLLFAGQRHKTDMPLTLGRETFNE